ncbi:hypothetical protein [uncultured Microbulbifer sp.]|uniref:hypothetical protein n=1 Tax=uncultured Microbulbifer sp. TaxID=348147 RepID=UPI002610FB0F|nr:hypothetical protein [uncultured Microbulbifer sp.]
MDSTTWDLMKPEEFEGAIERHYYTGFTQGYSESDIVGHDEPGLFLCQNPPFVSDLLERLAQAQSEQCPNNTAVAESKGQHGWDYIIFVRRMGTVFTAFLGGHRHETVDTLARVLLGVNPGDTTTRRNIEKSPYDKERTFFSE